MNQAASHLTLLRELFSRQQFAVLATQDQGMPYGSLVAFAATDDLRTLLFATARQTRKYGNMARESRAALVIDNRENHENDLLAATAVNAAGRAAEVDTARLPGLRQVFLDKHPSLRAFVESADCALIGLQIEVYTVVTQFQQVVELHSEANGFRLESHRQ